jgi:Leucine-rich repeat (LRR) protein
VPALPESLERLYACEMGLTVAPSVSHLRRLRTLDLGHNALTSVPDLSGLEELEILYLHDNALASLPALPRSLRYLNVSENPLASLAVPELPALLELRALDLGLSALDVRAPALRELHLRRNAFTAVPETVRGLRELRLLDLRANQLSSVPHWLAELPRLEKLDLRWNAIVEPPAELVARGCFVLTE